MMPRIRWPFFFGSIAARARCGPWSHGQVSNHLNSMQQHLALVSVVVRDYDEAISFYVDKLGFSLEEDRPMPAQNKRWVVVRPPGSASPALGVLLARAANEHQVTRVGDQTGGRVFLFLHTDDFDRDYEAYKARGVVFVREPTVEAYGKVAVFQDLYGNLWDLVEPSASERSS